MSKLARSSAVPARSSHVEPLESRIAPAVLVNGANLLGGAGNDNVGEMSLGDHSVTLVKVNAGQVVVWYQDGVLESISFGDGANFEVLGDVGEIIGNLGANGHLSDSDSNPLMPQIETLLASKMSTHIDNKTKAAGLLGITKPTLYSRLRGYERFK